MTFVINFISGPSVGKSLISSMVYSELKICGYITEYVQEYAKKLVWLKKWEKLDNQYLVSSKQYEIINILYQVPDIQYVVVDGALLLGLYYNRYYKTNVSNVEKTEEMILARNSEFKNIYIHLERNKEIAYEVQGRVQTYTESLEVDKELVRILDKLGIKYKSFKSSKESVQEIIKYIKECSKD